MILDIIVLINANIIILLILYVVYQIIKDRNYSIKRNNLYQNAEIILTIFQDTRKLVYNKFYQEKLIKYSTSGIKLDKSDLDKIQREYIKEVLSLCGENVVNDLVELFGNLESICSHLGNFFITQVNEDESKMLEQTREQYTESYEDNPNSKI